MHTKSAVVITLLMVSSLVCACGKDFFAPTPRHQGVPGYRGFDEPDKQPHEDSNRRNGETGVVDKLVKQFSSALGKMNRTELEGLLNSSGVKLLLSMKEEMRDMLSTVE